MPGLGQADCKSGRRSATCLSQQRAEPARTVSQRLRGDQCDQQQRAWRMMTPKFAKGGRCRMCRKQSACDVAVVAGNSVAKPSQRTNLLQRPDARNRSTGARGFVAASVVSMTAQLGGGWRGLFDETVWRAKFGWMDGWIGRMDGWRA